MRETAYLPFNAIGRFAYAINALNGIGAVYTVGLKVASVEYVADNYRGHIFAYDNTVTGVNEGNNRVFGALNHSLGGLTGNGFTAAGASAWTAADNPVSSETGTRKVIAVTRSPGAIKYRLAKASGLESSHTYTPSVDRTALHVSIAAALRHDHSIAVPSQVGDGRAISAWVAVGDVPDGELAAWVNAQDARGVVASLGSYWAFAGLTGGACPDLVGSVPLAVVGATSADLVAL